MVASLLRFLLALALAVPAAARAQSWGWDDGTVPYVQTPMEIVERILLELPKKRARRTS